MMNNSEKLNVYEIIRVIDHYLDGKKSDDDLVDWATLKMTELEYRGEHVNLEDHIISDALGAMMMLSINEPEEFRSTREDIIQVRTYLLGEEQFPLNRIPKQN